jgi:hypothetical protein
MVAVINAPRRNAEMLLSGLGTVHRLKAMAIGDKLPHGKPRPMRYLEGPYAVRAAPKLSIARSKILALTETGALRKCFNLLLTGEPGRAGKRETG